MKRLVSIVILLLLWNPCSGVRPAASGEGEENCARPGYLIVTADGDPAGQSPPIVEAVRSSGFFEHKSDSFTLSLATLGDIRAFCEREGCPFEEDRPAAIRAYVQSRYRASLAERCPLRYLLLIGPFDLLPPQLIWALPKERIEIRFSPGDALPHRLHKDAPPPELNVTPHFSDLYYEDMDGVWDRNGNGILAEVYDLTGERNCIDAYDPRFCDTDDLREYLPEIAMGRIPMRSLAPSEVAAVEGILRRITEHQREKPGWMKDLLFIAAPFIVPGDSAWLMEASKAEITAWQAEHPEASPFAVETAYWHRVSEKTAWERCPFAVRHLCGPSPMPDWTFENPFDRFQSKHWFQYPEKVGVVFINSHGNREAISHVLDSRYTQFWNALRGHRSVFVSIACSNAALLELCLPDDYRFCRKVDFMPEREGKPAAAYLPYRFGEGGKGCPEGYIVEDATSWGDIVPKDRCTRWNPEDTFPLREHRIYLGKAPGLNLASMALRAGATGFAAATATTAPGNGEAAWVAQQGFIEHLYFEHRSIGETIGRVRADYIERCVMSPGRCGFADPLTGKTNNYWLFKNFFIFVYDGDPSQFEGM